MEERIESNWDRVGVMGDSMSASSRVVKAAVRDPNKPHDEIPHPTRRRDFNFGRWYREKKSETSTTSLPPLLWSILNDSTPFDRVASPSVTIEERTELRSFAAKNPVR